MKLSVQVFNGDAKRLPSLEVLIRWSHRPVAPFSLFRSGFPYKVTTPPKQGALIIIWLLGHQADDLLVKHYTTFFL